MTKNVVRFYNQRQLGEKCSVSDLIRSRLHSCGSLYRKSLFGHFGCINAVEIEKSGLWMASGGDDRRVLIWNVVKTLNEHPGPAAVMQAEHDSNIFCLDFDIESKQIFSGGNDEKVLIHDLGSTKFVNQYLQEGPIFGISCHPESTSVFATACADGQVLLFDTRDSSQDDQLKLAVSTRPYHSVCFNSVEPKLLVTANQTEGVCLWDIRKPREVLIEYGAIRSNSRGAMSAMFNSNGTKIMALGRRQPVVLYDLRSPVKQYEFDHPGYFNSCTMKSGCFGGVDDEFVLSGSDDFNVYLWKIPHQSGDDFGEESLVNRATLVLRGHRSIVNQVRYNKTFFNFASSGIEKIIRLWSPLYLPGGDGHLNQLTKEEKAGRPISSRQSYLELVRSSETLSSANGSESTAESPRMIAFFDSLIRRDVEETTSSSDSSNNSDETESLYSVILSLSSSTTSSSEDEQTDNENNNSDSNLREMIETQEENISSIIYQKRLQLQRKKESRSRISGSNSRDLRRSVRNAKKSRHSLQQTSPEHEPTENVDDVLSTVQIPVALRDADTFESDDEVMRSEILRSLRTEVEEEDRRETLVCGDVPNQKRTDVQSDEQSTSDETPKFKKTSTLSRKRN